MNWQVYIIRCADGSLYTGITTEVARRLRQHAGGAGARYCRGRAPLALVYLEEGHSRSTASRREAAIKRLRRCEKERLVAASEEKSTCRSGSTPTPARGSSRTSSSAPPTGGASP